MSTDSGSVLYGLVQAVNPDLTLDYDQVAFVSAVVATQEQFNANGTNASVSLTASGHGDPVTIFYNQVLLANSLPSPNEDSPNFPGVQVPQAVYTTAQDFVPALVLAGFPMQASDVVATEIQNFWSSNPGGAAFMSLAGQLLTWSDTNVGYAGMAWVVYGPSAPADFATAFPQSYFANSFLTTGDAVQVFCAYNDGFLSEMSGVFGARFGRQYCTYSGLTVLDSGTSAEFGNTEVSAVITFENNPNFPTDYVLYPDTIGQFAPFYPFYSGSQTVYYNRLDPTTDFATILGGLFNTFFINDGVNALIPLGTALVVTEGSPLTSADLLLYLNKNMGSLFIDPTDIVIENLPTGYGEEGTVNYNLTFLNSYAVKDGVIPLTLSLTGPDADYVTAFAAASDFTDILTYQFVFTRIGHQLLNATIADIALVIWQNQVNGGADSFNWIKGLTTSLQGEITPVGDGSNNYTATIQVTTPWGTTFTQVVTYGVNDIGSIVEFENTPIAVDGVITLYADQGAFDQPMRIVDWLNYDNINWYSGSGIPTGSPGGTENPNGLVTLGAVNSWLIVGDFDNALDLALVNADGQISFTLTPNVASTLQTGTLTIVIVPNSTLPDMETSYGPSGVAPTPN